MLSYSVVQFKHMSFALCVTVNLTNTKGMCIQWIGRNSSIAATLGEQNLGRYIGVAFIEGLFNLYTNCSIGTCVPGRYTEVAFIEGWPLRGVPLYAKIIQLVYNFLFFF